MRNIVFPILILFFAGNDRIFAQNNDSREVLEWVKQTARRIDQSLQNAINTQDWPILLLSLMECEQDLTEGINSNDFHILMAKLDHAHRIFQETMHMTNTLEQCKEIHAAAMSGEEETMSALLESDWNVCVQHAQQALVHAQTIKQLAPDCHITNP